MSCSPLNRLQTGYLPLYEQDEQPLRSPSLHLLHSWWSCITPLSWLYISAGTITGIGAQLLAS